MNIAIGCNTQYFDNITNLNEVKRKIYDGFNTFNHRDPPTTDPIEQRNVLTWVMDNMSGLSLSESAVFCKIVRETVCRGYYYTFIPQKKIARHLGISERSVVSAIKKLQELGWIAFKRSNKKPYNNITDVNIEKIMALGKKGTELAKIRNEERSSANFAPIKRTLKDSSYEESNCSSDSFTTEDKEKFREKVSRKRKSHKKMRTTGSLAKTWVSSCNSSAQGLRKFSVPKTDMFKLSTVLGNKRVRGKWIGSTEDLHKFVEWTIAHWEYLRYRQSWAKSTPSEPNIGWFISQIYDIQCIWREETETKPKEPEINSRTKWEKIIKEKRRQGL